MIYWLLFIAWFVPFNAFAEDADSYLMPNDSTLYIQRETRPNPLLQEVDPSYAFHAKSAHKRLERSLYYILLARQEYLLYVNHMRTLKLKPNMDNLHKLESAILAFDKELNPKVQSNPLSNVITNLPEPSIVVNPENRSLIVSEPKDPYRGISKMYDGLASPRERLQRSQVEHYEAAPAATVLPNVRSAKKHSEKQLPQTRSNPLEQPMIPSYKPRTDTTCSTCADSGVTVKVTK